MSYTIKVIENNFIDIRNRIEKSQGTEVAFGHTCGNRRYKQNSYKPVNSWDRPEAPVLNAIFSRINDDTDYTNSLSLMKIPGTLTDIYEKIGFNKSRNQEEFDNLFKTKQELLKEANILLASFLNDLLVPGRTLGDVKLHCISFENGNLETTAYDGRDYTCFGLHIDKSNGNSIYERTFNSNRISINLGQEPRYLLFIDQTVNGIISLINSKSDALLKEGTAFSESDLTSLFFTLYPDYPVYRIKQAPYEAYIAPTDNIIHDGSTLGSHHPDISMVLLGYFKPFEG